MRAMRVRTKRRAALWVVACAMAILLGIVAYAMASTVTGTLSIDQSDVNAPNGYYIGETVHLVVTAFNDNTVGSFSATVAPSAAAMAVDPGDKKADVHVIMPDGSYRVIEATGTNIPLLPGQKIQWTPNSITISGPGTFLGTALPHTYLRSQQIGQGDGADPVPLPGMFDYSPSALAYVMTGNEPVDVFGDSIIAYEASGLQTGTRGLDYWHAQQTLHVFTLADHTAAGLTVSRPLVYPGDSVDTTITEFNGGTEPLTDPFVVFSQTGQSDVILNSASASLVSSGNGDGVLDVGETWTWAIHNVTITSATMFTAVGHGIDPRGNDVTFPADPQNPAPWEDVNEMASAKVDVISPNTLLNMSASPTSLLSGAEVTWTVTEKNSGDATLTTPYVNVNSANVDAAGVIRLDSSSPNFSGDTGSDGMLSPNETWTWTFTENPTTAEHYWAFGHAIDPLGTDICFANGFVGELDEASITLLLPMPPNTLVGISADPHMVSSGGLVTWTVTEKNTGDVVLTSPYVNVNNTNADAAGVVMLDASSPNFSGDTGSDGMLWPDETWTWTFTDNPTAPETLWAFGHGLDPLGTDVSFANGYTGERASDSVQIQGGATRTVGYWQTHAAVTNEVLGLCGGTLDIGWAQLDNYHETLGVLWSTPSKTTTGVPRKKLAQAKIILSRQLIAAELNDCLPNGDHSAETTIGLAITALQGTDTNTILSLAGQLDAFNNSGDTVPLQGLSTMGAADTGGTTDNKDFAKPNKLILGTEGPFL